MRMIAMGGEALVEGFSLLGFETVGNAAREDVEKILGELLDARDQAFVVLEHELAVAGAPSLDRVRREGSRIVVIELPPLQAPADYHPPVEELVMRVLGPNALEARR